MDAPLRFERDGHVAVLTINRPEERDALVGDDLFASFEDYALDINRDPPCAV